MDESQLWARLQAAGPFEDVPTFDPQSVDNIVWAERQSAQFDRRREFVATYSWAVPTGDAVGRICDAVGGRKVLEVCAGRGLWARLLSDRGVQVVATDGGSEAQRWFPVETQEASTSVLQHPECGALMLCWPPFKSSCAYWALRCFLGDLVISIGDSRFTAEPRFHSMLAESWHLMDEVPLPSWPGTNDRVQLYRPRRSAPGQSLLT